MNIYEISQEMNEVVAGYEAGHYDDQTFADTMEMLGYDFEKVAEDTIAIYKNINAEIQAVKSEEDKLKRRRERLNLRAYQLREYILDGMQKLDLRKVGQLHQASLRSTPPKVEIEDDTLIPQEYMVIKSELSKTAIKKAIEDGRPVPGARLTTGYTIKVV